MFDLLSYLAAEVYGYIKSYVRNLEFVIDILAWPLWVLGIVLGLAIYNPLFISDPGSLAWIAWGVLILAIISDKLWIVGHCIERELRLGILENIASSPEPVWLHYASIAVYSIISTFPAMVLTVAIIFPSLGINALPANLGLFTLGYVLAELASSGFALIYSSIAVVVKRPWIATNAMQFIIPILSGMVPYHAAPDQLKTVMQLNPLSYPFEIMKRGAMGQASMPVGLNESIALSILSIAIFYVAGIKILNRTIGRLKRRGTIQAQ